MRLATIKQNGKEVAAVVGKNGILPVKALNSKLNKNWSTELFEIIKNGQLEDMKSWFKNGGEQQIEDLANEFIPLNQVEYGPLFRHPRKI